MADTATVRRARRRPIREFFSRKYTTNPYTARFGTASKINQASNQYPKRMWRPKKVDPVTRPMTEEEMDIALAPPEVQAKYKEMHKDDNKNKVDPSREHMKGIELVHRHRYGDDLDILRAAFTKTVAEIEDEKFQLIVESRRLCSKLFWSLKTIPKHEKFVLGGNIRSSVLNILKTAIAIKKRFYRKNMLEEIDIELDVLREYYRLAKEEYPEWCNELLLQAVFNQINAVGAIVGGLLKSTVC